MILLTNEELGKMRQGIVKDDIRSDLNPDEVSKAQLKKVVGVLKDKTVKAWGGNRVILSEDWQAILKEVE